MHKFFYRLAILSMFVIGLGAAAALALAGVAADADAQTSIGGNEAYPVPGCTSRHGVITWDGTFFQDFADGGFVYCHAWMMDATGIWQWSVDGCYKPIPNVDEKCVSGIGTAHIRIDSLNKMDAVNVFWWAPHWLPVVNNGYP